VATPSSTRKAAKLAQRGKGRKVRFQGGTVFPMAVALVLVLGMALIAYSRQTQPAADDSPPTIEDHWHAAYGFYLCDDWYQLSGNLEQLTSAGTLASTDFARTGVHSHDDGVIHWHAYTGAATGRNAVLDVFLDNYGIELDNDTLKFDDLAIVTANSQFPPANGVDPLEEYVEGETQCNGEDAELTVKAWDSYTDTGSGNRYIANMDRIHLDKDAMVFAIYFTPKDAEQVMPPWAQDLPALGAVDTGSTEIEDISTTVPTGSTLPDGSSTEASTTEASTTEASTTEASATVTTG
jgi:hypothetical protein